MTTLQTALQRAMKGAKWQPTKSIALGNSDSCIGLDDVQLRQPGMTLEVFVNKNTSIRNRIDHLLSQGISTPDALLQIETEAEMNYSETEHSFEQNRLPPSLR